MADSSLDDDGDEAQSSWRTKPQLRQDLSLIYTNKCIKIDYENKFKALYFSQVAYCRLKWANKEKECGKERKMFSEWRWRCTLTLLWLPLVKTSPRWYTEALKFCTFGNKRGEVLVFTVQRSRSLTFLLLLTRIITSNFKNFFQWKQQRSEQPWCSLCSDQSTTNSFFRRHFTAIGCCWSLSLTVSWQNDSGGQRVERCDHRGKSNNSWVADHKPETRAILWLTR